MSASWRAEFVRTTSRSDARQAGQIVVATHEAWTATARVPRPAGATMTTMATDESVAGSGTGGCRRRRCSSALVAGTASASGRTIGPATRRWPRGSGGTIPADDERLAGEPAGQAAAGAARRAARGRRGTAGRPVEARQGRAAGAVGTAARDWSADLFAAAGRLAATTTKPSPTASGARSARRSTPRPPTRQRPRRCVRAG